MSSNSCRNSEDTEVKVDRSLVAIVGNPNAGKTTIFNNLTGSHQKVGNYPGVTVEKVSGTLKLSDGSVECIDVPGLYSIIPLSEDEQVAMDVIRGRVPGSVKPDLLVCVIDAGNLERNLFLFSQIAEEGLPMIIALTMVDRVSGTGSSLDISRLSERLGIDVIPVVGHKDIGIDELKQAISRNLINPRIPNIEYHAPEEIDARAGELGARLARSGIDLSSTERRRQILSPTEDFEKYLEKAPEMKAAFDEAREELVGKGLTASTVLAGRYAWTKAVEGSVLKRAPGPAKQTLTDKLDRILTHRTFGLIIFVACMYLVFQSIYTFARPIMDAIQWVFDTLGALVGPHLAAWPILQSAIVDGLISGVGAMLVFLPQILILFFFIAMLEGTGYLARAAFLMDRLLGWAGLNGRAFVPLLSSFACAIPGIMSARVMPDNKSRLATILVAPLMSCSARLPVYLLLIGAFIEPKYGPLWAGFALFAMHMLGLVVAIPIVWVLNKKILRSRRLPFLLELPPYQWPKWRDVWLAMYFRARVFVTTAGTIIVVMSILIWTLSYFPHSTEAAKRYAADYTARTGATPDSPATAHYVQEQQLANSYLGRFGKTLEPVFRPAGFDWRITTAILSAFPARETVVPSLGIIFSLGGEKADGSHTDIEKALQVATWPDGHSLMTPWTSVGLMVFFALCCQCMSTLATIKRETNSVKWPLFVFTYMTVLAYIGAVAIHQVGLLLGG